MNEYSAYAPGRVELLGNHTDYNEGYVLSAAIDRGVTITGAPNGSKRVTLQEGFPHQAETHLDRLERNGTWSDYPFGVVKAFMDDALPVGGFDARISSNLPPGTGLSSSAALEVATAKLLMKISGIELAPLRLAKLCRRAENEFVGVNCGVLDQISSVFGRAQHAVFIDCRTEEIVLIPFPADVTLLVTHSGLKRSLVSTEYNERRAQCFEAAQRLGVRALRDVSPELLKNFQDELPPLIFKRAAHVVGENARVLHAVRLLRACDVHAFGELMYASHESSRENFQNSTRELDELVAIARKEPGILGARLTGGGFGGATVTLVLRDAAEPVASTLRRNYRERTGRNCQTYICETADGAC